MMEADGPVGQDGEAPPASAPAPSSNGAVAAPADGDLKGPSPQAEDTATTAAASPTTAAAQPAEAVPVAAGPAAPAPAPAPAQASKAELFGDPEGEGDAHPLAAAAQPSTMASSALFESAVSGGDSLFAEVDAEEERRRMAEEAEAKVKAEVEAQARAEAEAAAAVEAERARKEAEAAAASLAAQQQALQSQMQTVNLNGRPAPPQQQHTVAAPLDNFYRQDLILQQQPQPQIPQQPQPAVAGNAIAGSSFLERSQLLQQQQQAQQQQQMQMQMQQAQQQQQQQMQLQQAQQQQMQQQMQMQQQQQMVAAAQQQQIGASYMYPAAGVQSPQQPMMGYSNLQSPQQQQQQHPTMQPSYVQQQPGNGLMHGRYANQPGQQLQQPYNLAVPPQTFPQSRPQPSVLAGLHVGSDPNVGGIHHAGAANGNVAAPGAQQPQPQLQIEPPPPFEPLYGHISCADPLLVQDSGFFAGPPHWTYAVGVRPPGESNTAAFPNTSIRRRFRHFVALEERIRDTCPGAILPPRPEKHAVRAIEEGSTSQSAHFALQRTKELEDYLNALAQHPIAGQSPVLRLFLTLQDDIGTAWPEVSSSAITRLGAVVENTSVKMAEGTSNLIEDVKKDQMAAGEDNAELLALAANEGVRMGSCVQAIPKIEGAIAVIREQGERAGFTGMEVSKLAKDIQGADPELSGPLEVLSGGLLRSGRRTKRLAVELSAANAPFVSQYKLCRYERMAFADRRAALKRRTAARGRANGHAQKLMMQQHQIAVMGGPQQLGRMEVQTAMADEYAVGAVREADQVGITLQREVDRIAELRLIEWSASIKVLASSMKEACAERVAVWEGCKEQFLTSFPEFNSNGMDAGGQVVFSPTTVETATAQEGDFVAQAPAPAAPPPPAPIATQIES